ncbi:hypothetical protein PSI15_13565 [Xenorhabdus sp. PR6a]|uniref:hypothetical protein n=1 Tax=Xenorhabdus sp. PR6a TaxID=3025877 RepID=UPI002359A907|nr:hypothetical protein [Xenorhabdus sp. PR6a]MDC9582578.1 hypothetical protein [Xenorhabdus sp. PR6a]
MPFRCLRGKMAGDSAASPETRLYPMGCLHDGRLWLDLRCLEEAHELLQVLVL